MGEEHQAKESSRPQRDNQLERHRGIKWVRERTVFLVGRRPLISRLDRLVRVHHEVATMTGMRSRWQATMGYAKGVLEVALRKGRR